MKTSSKKSKKKKKKQRKKMLGNLLALGKSTSASALGALMTVPPPLCSLMGLSTSVKLLTAPEVTVVNPYDKAHRKSILDSEYVRYYIAHTGLNYDYVSERLPCSMSPAVGSHFSWSRGSSSTLSVRVDKPLGKGSYGVVYAVSRTTSPQKKTQKKQQKTTTPSKQDMTNAANSVWAIKLEKPALNLPWEFFLLSTIRERLLKRNLHKEVRRFIQPKQLFRYEDGCAMLMPCGHDGTLQDLVNAYQMQGKKVPELLVLCYSVEMLRSIQLLHSLGVLHTDCKPDNWLLCGLNGAPPSCATPAKASLSASAGASAARSPKHVDATGAMTDAPRNAWEHTPLVLIDFGRSIEWKLDKEQAAKETTFGREAKRILFTGKGGVGGFECAEMQDGRPWLYQADTVGVCGTLHFLLHGEYLEMVRLGTARGGSKKGASSDGRAGHEGAGRAKSQCKGGEKDGREAQKEEGADAPEEPVERYCAKLPFKRYWDKDLWSKIFDVLLNGSPGGQRMKTASDLVDRFAPSTMVTLRELIEREIATRDPDGSLTKQLICQQQGLVREYLQRRTVELKKGGMK
jgi:serine/threonine protein kinase